MKNTLSKVFVGERLKARVIEIVGNREFIVNFCGDLIRVVNNSEKNLKIGSQVELVVTTISPLGFRLMGRSSLARGLSVSV